MTHSPKNRRQFIKISVFSLLALPVLGLVRVALGAKVEAKGPAPLPAGETAVPESNPVATAIGYKSDIKNIDYAKYPQRKSPAAKNQFCDNCALYTPTNASWGKCQMLNPGLVTSKGWCASWSKKA